jgi:serine/threonine-protein kinase
MFHAGTGLLTTDVPTFGNGLRAYSIDEPQVCFGNYVCHSWAVPVDGTVATPPVLTGGGEVAYTGTDAGTVYAVDGATGQVLWTRSVGTAVVDTPALAGGSLYVPTSDRGLVVLDAATGTPRWSATPDATVVAQPAVAGGVVFTASTGGTLAAYDAGGCGAATCTPLWTAEAGAEVTGGPTVDRGLVYVGTAAAHLQAYALR